MTTKEPMTIKLFNTKQDSSSRTFGINCYWILSSVNMFMYVVWYFLYNYPHTCTHYATTSNMASQITYHMSILCIYSKTFNVKLSWYSQFNIYSHPRKPAIKMFPWKTIFLSTVSVNVKVFPSKILLYMVDTVYVTRFKNICTFTNN